ncbi:MAG: hypothetical protein IKM54_03390, partial [Butyricicoccus sp.]|nr:hypothetical protein [Butyricicoccus sp.]
RKGLRREENCAKWKRFDMLKKGSFAGIAQAFMAFANLHAEVQLFQKRVSALFLFFLSKTGPQGIMKGKKY